MKNKKIILAIITAVIFTTLPFSCKKKKEDPEFDRASLLTNIGNNIIVPSYSTLKAKTETLSTVADAFATTPDNTNLTALQDAWKEAATAWKRCETYTFAYALDHSIDTEIDAWPTNTALIENEISGSNTLDETYVSNSGTTRKGLPAIEYLIFSTSGNSDVINKFTATSNYARRQQYLKALAADIKTKSSKCYKSWSSNGGNYVSTFIANSSDDAGSSVTILFNAMVQGLEVVKNKKLGIPLGEKSNGTLHPELVEARISEMSLEDINSNLKTLEDLYLGRHNGSNEMGFDDYLNFVNADYEGQPLSEVVKKQFENCYSKVNAITPTLENSVTNETTKVNAAYLEYKKLVVLMKLDMASQLGIIITFSDNDGD